MQIQAPFKSAGAERVYDRESVQNVREPRNYNSTLATAGSPSLIRRTFAYVIRKISNFFRAIFSCFLPIKPRANVSLNEITFLRTRNEQADMMKYQILLNGFGTNNEIGFKKINGALYLEEITFPDQEMRQHMHAILSYMLQKEEVDAVTTDYLDRAKILWDCGFSSKDSVIFDPHGTDHSSKTMMKIIEGAEKKRNLLNGHYLEILLRVERILVSEDRGIQKLIDSFIDLAASVNVIAPRAPGVSVPVTDLLSLLEIVEIGSVRGVRFANYGQGGLATFKDIADNT